MTEIVARAVSVGWRIKHTAKGVMIFPPTGTPITLGLNSQDDRGYKNALAALERAGIAQAEKDVASLAASRRVVTLAVDRAKNGAPTALFHAPVDDQNAAQTQAGMFTRSELLNGDLAMDFLTRPPARLADGTEIHQRHLDVSWVNEICGWIERGEWRESYEGIAVAVDGGLIEGMHRCHAVLHAIERGILPPDGGIPVRVTYNAPPELFMVTNRGKVRTASNMLQTVDVANAYIVSSALKLLYCYTEYLNEQTGPLGDWRNWTRIRPSNTQLHGLLRSHPRLGEAITLASPMAVRTKGIVAAATTFVYLAMEAWPADAGVHRLGRFVDTVREGVNVDKGDPAHTVREWMLTNGGGRGDKNRRERQLFALLQAWQSYAVGKERRSIRFRDDQPMPLPYTPRTRGL